VLAAILNLGRRPMPQSIHAIYENGVFRPTQPVNLPDHAEVELELQPINTAPSAHRRLWREIRGSAASPLLGEDAQAWVSRTRQESDDRGPTRVGP
jgi:predicted DNA-binding antitoxin AbrB/MazE fold protein